MKIPQIIHMIWIGPKPPAQYFWNNLEKWKALMPHWTFMVWTNEMLTTEYISKSYLELLEKCRNGAQAADLLSYYVVEKWGGYLLDADITPFRSLDELDTENSDVVLCHDLPNTWEYIATGFFGAVPHHQLFKNLVDRAYYTNFQNPDQHLTTGPGIMGREVYNLNWEDHGKYLMLPYWAFYRNRIGDPGPHMPDRVMQDNYEAFGNHFYAAEWTKNI